jgi:hypothetical protein
VSATHLVVCPSCARHVRAREESCPFCRSVLSETLRETPEPLGPAVRLSRGALHAFGVGALAVATGCSSSSAMLIQAYGGAPIDAFQYGVMLGASCEGKVYVTGQVGYAFCDDGAWAYTSTNPATSDAGYTPLGDGGVSSDAGEDAEAGAVHDARTDTVDAEPDGTVDGGDAIDSGDAG